MLKQLLSQLLRPARRAPLPEAARDAGAGSPAPLRQQFELLLRADDCDAALALAQGALAQDAESYEARLLLGRAHQKLHQADRALACFDAAHRLRQDDAELYDFRGSLFQELGRLAEALADFDRALTLRPDFPAAAFHRAMARLLAGDFARGWDDYELRRLNLDHAQSATTFPRWDGSTLAGRTLLITREQGLGDEIMYASMLPQLLAQGGRCVVECDPRLLRLFGRSFPSATFFGTLPAGGLPAEVPRASIDVTIEAGSLARFLRRDAAAFPRHSGYLRADPGRKEHWRKRLDALGPGLKIGLSWTGGVRKTRRALRSLSLEQLLPLLRVPGARYVSLQYTRDAPGELAELRGNHGIEVPHWQEAIDDYGETAALVGALDLTVSVCTSLVHLCGALGRPAWVLTPIGPEWRYGIAGESMVWYPSVRLFRQAAYADWPPVVDRVAAEVAALRRNPASAETTAGSE